MKDNIFFDLGPLYHNYSFFGIHNEQLPGIYELNQKAKAPIIIAYMAHAYAKSKEHAEDAVSFTELFCADGYYAMVAIRLGYTLSIGIDNNKDGHFVNATEVSNRLNLNNISFVHKEITPDSEFFPTDVVANIGGLYHVDNPGLILKLSFETAKKYLIVQSVVSLSTNDDYYYEAPAPGWTWGNRFSRQSFDKMMNCVCPNIIDCHYNELEGNDRLEDRGSVYYLIKK